MSRTCKSERMKLGGGEKVESFLTNRLTITETKLKKKNRTKTKLVESKKSKVIEWVYFMVLFKLTFSDGIIVQ